MQSCVLGLSHVLQVMEVGQVGLAGMADTGSQFFLHTQKDLPADTASLVTAFGQAAAATSELKVCAPTPALAANIIMAAPAASLAVATDKAGMCQPMQHVAQLVYMAPQD